MKRKYFANNGQVKEQKKPKKPKTGKEYNKVSIRVQPEPDRLMHSLDVPLTAEQTARILELHDYGWLRSDIAKELGIPKTRVNHELMQQKGGGAA